MADWDSEIYLLEENNTTNAAGDQVKGFTPRKIFANKHSIRSKEFYQAQATDLKPEIEFEIWLGDYNDEHFLTYAKRIGDDPKQYTIIKTYEKNNDRIMLTCARVVNKVAT